MKCPEVHFGNPGGMKFCGECETRLERICPHCDFSNPLQFKFCGERGQNLKISPEPTPEELSFDEKLDMIQRYFPKGLSENIPSQMDKVEGERKQVTVMFCDRSPALISSVERHPPKAPEVTESTVKPLSYCHDLPQSREAIFRFTHLK